MSDATPSAIAAPLRWWRGGLLALNVASLDAPLVAVAWALLLARTVDREPQPAELALLAAGVWLGYAADRWLDGRRLGQRAGAARHRLAARRPRAIGALWVVTFVAALVAAVQWLDAGTLSRAVALAALVAAYTLAIALWPDVLRRLVPRELAVGVLFAAGCAVFAFGTVPPTGAALGLTVAFAGLCVANCVAVALAERELDRAAEEVSLALSAPATERLFAPTVASLGFTLAVVAAVGLRGPQGLVALALVAAAASLVVVQRLSPSPPVAPAVADLCLALPALLVATLL